ncbi:MAG: hypothetical protein WCD07_10415 [Burkholderiales bacterium]
MNDVNRFTLDMSITHADFFRLLPAAIVPYESRVNGSAVDIFLGQRRVIITLGSEQQRRITDLLSLPRTQVEFLFEQFDDVQREAFMHRFDRYFHRGGG